MMKIHNTRIYCRFKNGEYSTIYNSDIQCEIAGVKKENIIKAFVQPHPNQDRDSLDKIQYWGWLSYEKNNKISMIHSGLMCTMVCSPDFFKNSEEKGLGILIRINILTEDDLRYKVLEILSKDYNDQDICEDFDQEIIEWVSEEELEEHDGSYYDAYMNYGHGEAESTIAVKITNDIIEQLQIIQDDIEIHLFILYIITETFDILDH